MSIAKILFFQIKHPLKVSFYINSIRGRTSSLKHIEITISLKIHFKLLYWINIYRLL